MAWCQSRLPVPHFTVNNRTGVVENAVTFDVGDRRFIASKSSSIIHYRPYRGGGAGGQGRFRPAVCRTWVLRNDNAQRLLGILVYCIVTGYFIYAASAARQGSASSRGGLRSTQHAPASSRRCRSSSRRRRGARFEIPLRFGIRGAKGDYRIPVSKV